MLPAGPTAALRVELSPSKHHHGSQGPLSHWQRRWPVPGLTHHRDIPQAQQTLLPPFGLSDFTLHSWAGVGGEGRLV